MALLSKVGFGAVVIDVILPTYNGVAFLREQVVSIYQQTLRPRKLIIRDDGSTDGTKQLLQSLKQQYGTWLVLLPFTSNLGCVGNVNILLKHTDAPYVALSDQDDIWLPEKLSKSLSLLRKGETFSSCPSPLLVHTDLALVNQYGELMHQSFINYQRLDPSKVTLDDLSLTNVVTGCTVLMNRPLIDLALPIPKEALMHDWWFALVASRLGSILFLNEATILYRQHSNNVLGAHRIGLRYYFKRIILFLRFNRHQNPLERLLAQIDSLNNRYGDYDFAVRAFLRKNLCQRMIQIITFQRLSDLKKHGPIRTMILYLLALMYKNG